MAPTMGRFEWQVFISLDHRNMQLMAAHDCTQTTVLQWAPNDWLLFRSVIQQSG